MPVVRRSIASKKQPITLDICDQQKRVALPHRLLKKRWEWVARELDEKYPGKLPREINIVFLDAKAMTQVHENFMTESTPTDVITFHHGEVVICPDVAVIQGKHYNKKPEEEVLLYGIHGLLHLAGYDDLTKTGYMRMKQTQERLLKAVVAKVRR